MKSYKYLGLITTLYIAFQLISDVTAGKIVQFGSFTLPASILYFPITYIFADVLTEVYGYSKARNVVWQAFLASIVAGLVYQLAVWLPPAVGFDANDAYIRVLGSVPRILLGGWIAVWAGGIANDYILAKMKIWTKGKYLWMRTIGSTIVGEGVNTFLFFAIALSGILPNSLLVSSILSGWLFKVVIETVLTPLTYLVVAKLKKVENEDYYDTNTNFNPLIIKS
ncbi:MAG: queuosine precursor transporter [bacterium]|nr:queuosine precursor transporter [bacterium]